MTAAQETPDSQTAETAVHGDGLLPFWSFRTKNGGLPLRGGKLAFDIDREKVEKIARENGAIELLELDENFDIKETHALKELTGNAKDEGALKKD